MKKIICAVINNREAMRCCIVAFTIATVFLVLRGAHAQEDKEANNETLLFQTTATLSATAQRTQQGLHKGLSVSFPVEANTRYASLITSQNLDSVLQLELENNSVFRDIFLGENAGVVFTPFFVPQNMEEEEQETLQPQNATTRKVSITALFHAPKKQNTVREDNEPEALGSYTLSVYKITSKHRIESLPFVEHEAPLTKADVIIGRISREYALSLTKNTRLYAFMASEVFDTLLEFSNAYGEVVASDDWIKDEARTTSLLSLVVPQDGTYFITPTSFSGAAEGAFSLRVFTTQNEALFSETATLSTKDTKIFKQHVREYPLSLNAEEAATISVSALSGGVEVIFARDDRSALYAQKVGNGKTKSMPVFAEDAGSYKIIIASDAPLPINYTIAVYK